MMWRRRILASSKGACMTLFLRSASALSLCVVAAFSQETAPSDTTSQGRRIEQKLDAIHDDVRVLRSEVVESPLGNRKWGIEFNPARPLVFAGDALSLSGGVSNFSWNREAEVAFPFVLWIFSDDQGSIYTQDVHYRHFLSGRQRGFYVGGYARYQYAHYGQVTFTNNAEPKRSINRGGLAFELGGRVFSRSGLYWGWSVSLGRYIVGDELDTDGFPNNPFLWTGDLILDVEVLKLGFAF